MLRIIHERIPLLEWLDHMSLFHTNVQIRNESAPPSTSPWFWKRASPSHFVTRRRSAVPMAQCACCSAAAIACASHPCNDRYFYLFSSSVEISSLCFGSRSTMNLPALAQRSSHLFRCAERRRDSQMPLGIPELFVERSSPSVVGIDLILATHSP
jgi:hypothetical protein